jgi:hypothetical protein
MGKSTIAPIVLETCQAIWNELRSTLIPVPTKELLQNIIGEYYTRWNFPNCFGAIDGKHCRIKCPENSASNYYCYKKYFYTMLQGVADADYKFITVEVGGAGRQNDGGTFAAYILYQLSEYSEFDVPDAQQLQNSLIRVPDVSIGNKAYPLKTYLMRPYPQNNLTPDKSAFKYRLSRAIRCVECNFGILFAK